MILPLVKFLKTLYIQKYGSVLSILYVWCFHFVLHTQNSQDTNVMKQTTVHVQLRKIQKDNCLAFTESSRHQGKEMGLLYSTR